MGYRQIGGAGRADAKRIDRGGERESFSRSRGKSSRTPVARFAHCSHFLLLPPRPRIGERGHEKKPLFRWTAKRARLYRNSGVAARPFIGRFAQIGARAAPRRVVLGKVKKSLCCKLNHVVARNKGCLF